MDPTPAKEVSRDWPVVMVSEFRKVLESNALEGGYVFPREIGAQRRVQEAGIPCPYCGP